MSMKGYACNRFPQYGIGTKVKFNDGFFETDDPEVQKLIESHAWFGVHIGFGARGSASGAPPSTARKAVLDAVAGVRSEIKNSTAKLGKRGTK
jgi:hypothetical protein